MWLLFTDVPQESFLLVLSFKVCASIVGVCVRNARPVLNELRHKPTGILSSLNTQINYPADEINDSSSHWSSQSTVLPTRTALLWRYLFTNVRRPI